MEGKHDNWLRMSERWIDKVWFELELVLADYVDFGYSMICDTIEECLKNVCLLGF